MRITTDRGAVEVHRSGHGDRAIVLLHPLALDGSFWAPVAEHLAGHATVLAFDARGHGGSDWDGQPFTVEDMADDVAAVLRELGVTAAVLGMSMGGCTALALAARHPELVSALVLADTTACYGPQRIEQWAERAAKATDVPRVRQLDFQLGRWFSDEFRARRPDEATRVADIFVSTSSAAHAQACRALGAFDRRDDLPAITVPSLVLVGEDDAATPVPMAKELAAGLHRAELEILPGRRHFSLLEQAATWPRLRDHLTAN